MAGMMGSALTPGGNTFTSTQNGVVTGMGGTVAPAPTPAPTPVPTPAPTAAPGTSLTLNSGQNVGYDQLNTIHQQAQQDFNDILARSPWMTAAGIQPMGLTNVDATGMMGPAPAPPPAGGATPAPAPSGAPAPGAAPAPAQSAQVANWYRNVAGRDATAEEIAWHQQQVATLGPEKAYAGFLAGLGANGEVNKGLDLSGANAAYQGYRSTNQGSLVDEWARNELGRAPTAEELRMFGDYERTPEQAQADYARFIAAAKAAGQTPKELGLVQASQLGGVQPQVGYQSYGAGLDRFDPQLDRQIDARNETIEGRINGLMAQDAQGNYTNQVVRQAVDRAMQTFAERGLLNSSMAAQAGQEAAIAKAIEIAGPDAERYFQQGRANQDAANIFARDETQQNYTERNNLAQWAHEDATQASDQQFRETILTKEQSFTLRQNYIEANDNANARFNAAVNNINASNMTPEDKAIAIQQAQAVRDGDLAYNNNMFAAQPGFAREWLAVAVPTQGMDVSKITNMDTLVNIANDPAQPEADRAAARAKIASMGGDAGDGPTSMENLPRSIDGKPINWTLSPEVKWYGAKDQSSLAKQYSNYIRAGGTMSAEIWYRFMQTPAAAGSGGGGGGPGNEGPGDGVGTNANGDAAGVGAGPR